MKGGWALFHELREMVERNYETFTCTLFYLLDSCLEDNPGVRPPWPSTRISLLQELSLPFLSQGTEVKCDGGGMRTLAQFWGGVSSARLSELRLMR